MITQAVGAYGEKVVEAELLRHCWTPANVNATIKNAADYDVFALKGNRSVAIRVKTCGPELKEFTFNAEPGQAIITEGFGDSDFTVCVSMGASRRDDEFYIVPTAEVRKALAAHKQNYMNTPRRDGGVHVDNGQWLLRLKARQDGTDNPGYGFETKWANYKDNWALLEAKAKPPA